MEGVPVREVHARGRRWFEPMVILLLAVGVGVQVLTLAEVRRGIVMDTDAGDKPLPLVRVYDGHIDVSGSVDVSGTVDVDEIREEVSVHVEGGQMDVDVQ